MKANALLEFIRQHLLYEISYYIYSQHQIKIFFYINNMVVIKMCQKLIPDLIYNLLLWNISQQQII